MVWKGHNYGLCKKCGKIHINPFLGKKHTVESKFKMSQKIKTARSLKKWSAWNKGLTKETDERVK